MKKIIFVLIGFLVAPFLKAQTLESYIEQAEASNPEVQAFELRYNISMEKVEEANALPNTELSAGYYVSEPETRTGAQKARLTVRQMLPWFGTITARENYATALADVDYLDITIIKRKLRLSLSQSYYKLYAIKSKQAVLKKNVQLLKTYEKLALTSLEVGNASAVDVLRLQMRQNELQEQKEVLGMDFLAEKTLFNNLLNSEENADVALIDSLYLPSGPDINQSELELHPELEKYDILFQSVEQSEILNQKESNPSLGFGLDYIPVEARPDLDFSDNGKDILMPMVSLSIPIFNNKYKSNTIQNDLKQQEISAQKANRKNKLETILGAALNNRVAARIKYNTQIKNLKQAADAEEILIKNYETGTIDFDDVLDIQELQLKFQMNEIDAVKMYYLQSAIINYLSNQ